MTVEVRRRVRQAGRDGFRWAWPRRVVLAGSTVIVLVGVLLAVALLRRESLTSPGPERIKPAPSDSADDDGGVTPTTRRCLIGDGSRVRVAGVQTSGFSRRALPASTLIDAGSASWVGADSFPVRLGGGAGICLSGGQIRGTFSPDTSWRVMHSTAALTVSSPRATVSGIRIDNYGDGVRFLRKAKNFSIDGAYFSYIRDDCVENDWLLDGSVDDTLLDGCYSAFSSRPYGQREGLSGREHTVSIRRTLVRLQPMDQVYRNRGVTPGHDGFFKWHRRSPRLSLHDNVFRADQPANNVGLGIPSDKLTSCANNVMVWLGRGPYPAPLPSCFRITTDPGVWDRAVADWKRRHGHGG